MWFSGDYICYDVTRDEHYPQGTVLEESSQNSNLSLSEAIFYIQVLSRCGRKYGNFHTIRPSVALATEIPHNT